MKSAFLVITFGLACLAGGLSVGWWLWAESKVSRTSHSNDLTEVRSQTSGPTSEPATGQASATLQRVSTELAEMRNLSPQAFAAAMVDNWLEYANPGAMLRRGLFLDQCTPERAVEFYLEYKRRKGMPLTQNAGELREFFTMMGKRFGPELVQQYLKLNPEGIPEIDSHIHGWATAQPKAAVDWLNGLPEGSPLYPTSLKGLIWGLGESSPSTALQVYRNLTVADQRETVWNMTNSVVEKVGLRSLNQMLETATPTERLEILKSAVDHASWRPPAEYVTEMAQHLPTAPFLTKDFGTSAKRWATSAPQDALAWLTMNASNKNYAMAVNLTAQALRTQGLSSQVDTALGQR